MFTFISLDCETIMNNCYYTSILILFRFGIEIIWNRQETEQVYS